MLSAEQLRLTCSAPFRRNSWRWQDHAKIAGLPLSGLPNPQAHQNPCLFRITTLGIAPTRVAITGFAAAMASRIDMLAPSFNEGCPWQCLEAMAAAKPVIATRVGAIPRVVIPEKTGILVEPGDSGGLKAAILRFLRDPATATNFARNGAEHVKRNCSALSMAQKYLNIYTETRDHRRLGIVRARQTI